MNQSAVRFAILTELILSTAMRNQSLVHVETLLVIRTLMEIGFVLRELWERGFIEVFRLRIA